MAEAFIQKPKLKSDAYARLLERRKTSEMKHVNRIRLPSWQFIPWEDTLRDSSVNRDGMKIQSFDYVNVYTRRKPVASEDEGVIRSLEKKRGDSNNPGLVKQHRLERKPKQKTKLKNDLKTEAVAQNGLNHDKSRSQLKKEFKARDDKNVKLTSKPEKFKSNGQSKSKIMARKIVKQTECRQNDITETAEKYSCEFKSKENMSKNVRDAEIFDTEVIDSLEMVSQTVIGRNSEAVNKLYPSTKSTLSSEYPETWARASKKRSNVRNRIKENTEKSSSSEKTTENLKSKALSKTSKQIKLTTPAEASQTESRETVVKTQRDKISIESSKEGNAHVQKFIRSSMGETKESGIRGNEEEIENASEKDVRILLKIEHYKSAKSINQFSMSSQASESYDQMNSEEISNKGRKNEKNGKSEGIPLNTAAKKNKAYDLKLAKSVENYVEKKDWIISHSETPKDEGKTETKTAQAMESNYQPEDEENYLKEISDGKRKVNEKNEKSEEISGNTTVNGNKANDLQLVNNYLVQKERKIGHSDPTKDQVKAEIMTQYQVEAYRKRNEDKIRNLEKVPGKITQRENCGKRLISISPQSIAEQRSESDIDENIPKEMLDTSRTGNEMNEKSDQISTETIVKKNKAYHLRGAMSIGEYMAEKGMAINTTKTEANTQKPSNLLLKFTESVPNGLKNALKAPSSKDTVLLKWLHGLMCSHQEKTETASYSLITDNYSIHILKKPLYIMETSSNEMLKSFNWKANTSAKENKAYDLRWTMSTEKYMGKCALKSPKVNTKTSDETESYAIETSETSASKHDKRQKCFTISKIVNSLNRQMLQALLTETNFEANRDIKPNEVQNTLKTKSLTDALLEPRKLQIVFNRKSVTGEDFALFVQLDGVPGSPLLPNFRELCRSYSQLWGGKRHFQQIQSAQEDVAPRPDGYLPQLKLLKSKDEAEESEKTEHNYGSAVYSNGL